MHDVVEVTRTVLCHTHLVVCQTCDWIAVSGRHQAVVLFLYSEHLPLCVCAKTPLYIKHVWKKACWSITVVLSQSILWLVEITGSTIAQLRHYCLHQMCEHIFDVLSHVVQEFFLSVRCTTWNNQNMKSCKQLLPVGELGQGP